MKGVESFVALLSLILCTPGLRAQTPVVFADSTFNPADYNQTSTFGSNGSSVTLSPTGSGAFTAAYNYPGSGTADFIALNQNWSYDPAVLGPAVTIDVSATLNFDTVTSGGWLAILSQGGAFYAAPNAATDKSAIGHQPYTVSYAGLTANSFLGFTVSGYSFNAATHPDLTKPFSLGFGQGLITSASPVAFNCTFSSVSVTVNHDLADVRVNLVPTVSSAVSGQFFTYIVEAENLGNAAAQNVKINVSLPPGVLYYSCTTCTPASSAALSYGTLAAGGISDSQLLGPGLKPLATTQKIVVQAPVVTTPTPITATATITTTSPQVSPANNQTAVTVMVSNSAVTPAGGGPPGGGISYLAIDSQNFSTVYAASSRYLFKSTNGGGTWAPAMTGISALGFGITALIADPFVSGTAYTVSDEGLFRTTDSGATWKLVNVPTGVIATSIAADPSNRGTLYLGTRGMGVLKSIDSGAHWSATGNQITLANGVGSPNGVSSLLVTPTTPAAIWAGTGLGLYQSNDGGANWTYRCCNNLPTYHNENNTVELLAVDPVDTATAYASHDAIIYKTTDGGKTWNNIHSASGLFNYDKLAVDPSKSSTLYLSNAVKGVYKSFDGGINWTESDTGIHGALGSVAGLTALAIDRSNPAVLYGASFIGIFKSTNGGANWTLLNSGIAEVSPNILAVDPSNPGTVYATTSIGLFKSVDGGASWILTGAGLPFEPTALAIDPNTPTTLYAGGTGLNLSGVFKSVDGGATFAAAGDGLPIVKIPNLLPEVETLAIDPINPGVLYAGGNLGVYRSADGGGSWTVANSGLPTMFFHGLPSIAVDPSNSGTLYAAAGQMGVYKSDDGGASWTAANQGIEQRQISTLAIDPSNPATLYAGCTGPTDPSNGVRLLGPSLYKSLDGGGSWTPLDLGAGWAGAKIGVLLIDPAQPTTLYAAATLAPFQGQVASLLMSPDGGASWTAIDAGLPAGAGFRFTFEGASAGALAALAIDPSNSGSVYVARGGVFKTTDYGATWQPTGAR